MNILIAGATGATGRLVVQQLLEQGHGVKAVVRSPQKLAHLHDRYPNFLQIKETVLLMSSEELAEHTKDCDALVSCLGHTLDWHGMYGKPRKLVRDSVIKLCETALTQERKKPVKLVLMNTSGNTNRDLNEKYSLIEQLILKLLYAILPPHADNVQAAEYLRTTYKSSHPKVEWVAVRPDSLTDEDQISEYTLHESPMGGVIFGAHKTSRINTAHFMARLIEEDQLWNVWKGRMPLIYNA